MKPRTLMTAFAATLVACAVGAPAASATVTVDPLTVTEADGTLTFHFGDPESGAAVLIDSNDDAKADQIIRAWRTDAPNPPYASLSALTLSTTSCQEEKQGPQGQGGVTAVITSRWPAATGDDVTLTVPRSALPRTFTAKAISFAGPDTRPIPGGPNGYFLGACIITDLQGAVRFPVVATPVVPLDAPTGLTAVPGAWQVTLTWNPVERADGYNIYADGNLYQQTGPGLLSIPVFAQPGSPVRYEVAAFSHGVEYARSASVTATATDFPQPSVDPQPPVSATDPADPDADGIRNDWLIHGTPAPGPAKPKTRRVTGTSVTIKLPKAQKGTTIAVYVRAAHGTFAKAPGKANKRGELTIKRLKRNTVYELKLVKVKAAKQSAASKTLKVKTRK